MNEYLLLFRGGDAHMASESPEAMQQHMQKWMTWMKNLGDKGLFLGGQPLTGEGKIVKGGGKLVTDGPFTEGKEIVGGYLIIKANDLDHASELSKECPIHEFEGIVEVRPIQKMEM